MIRVSMIRAVPQHVVADDSSLVSLRTQTENDAAITVANEVLLHKGVDAVGPEMHPVL